MLFAMMFAFWRFLQIVTLIPIMGMLAYFVDGYVKANALTPNYILVLFIVSVLALAWAIFTLFSYHRSSTNARFVSVIDLAFVGAFIAGVWYLRFIASADCTAVRSSDSWYINFGLGNATLNGYSWSTDKACAMYKACFALGIVNCILFFITAILAWVHGGRMSSAERPGKTRYYRETHVSRHGHRHSRSPHSHHSHQSHHSRRSSRSHSHRRVYV